LGHVDASDTRSCRRRGNGIEGQGPDAIAAIITEWPSRDGTKILAALSATALFLSGLVLLWAYLNKKRREAELKWKADEAVRAILPRFRAEAEGADPDALANAFGAFLAARFGIPRSEALSPRRALMDCGAGEALVSKVELFLQRLDARRFQKEAAGVPEDLLQEGLDLAARLDEEALP